MSERLAEELMQMLVGYAYPNAESLAEDEGKFVRRWIVRCEREVPSQSELDDLARQLAAEVAATLREALKDAVPPVDLPRRRVNATIVGIAPRHCVVSIESPNPDMASGNEAAIGTWNILRGLDNAIGIEDLEGIPKRFWFPMR